MTDNKANSVYTSIILLIIISSLIFNAGCAALVVGGAVTTASVAVDKRTAGDMVEDQSISIKFKHKIYSNPQLKDKTNINMLSYNGWVLLTGEVDTEINKESIHNIALDIKNVKRVFNELIISEPSSLQSRANDSYLTSKINLKLLGMVPELIYHTSVVVEHRTVYLMGLLSNHEADSIVDIVKEINGVVKIVKLFDYQ